VTLARGLDILVTAEGIETPEQFERLKALGVDFAQGYLLGRPLPIGELEPETTTYASLSVDANAA
jgi:EAL domain-containing protein (putative c-di-GMP-specific phosphodiesterase class I)